MEGVTHRSDPKEASRGNQNLSIPTSTCPRVTREMLISGSGAPRVLHS